MAMASSIIRWLMPLSISTIYSPLLQQIIVMKLLSFKHIFILGALLAAGSVQVHAADEVTGKSEELELTDSIVHDTLVLADGKLTRYDRRIMRYRKHWDLLIPTSGIIQTCGNMGIIRWVSDGNMVSAASGKRSSCLATSRSSVLTMRSLP